MPNPTITARPSSGICPPERPPPPPLARGVVGNLEARVRSYWERLQDVFEHRNPKCR